MAEVVQIPATGFLRVKQIIGDRKASPPVPGIYPVCRTTWCEGVKSGLYPKPVKLGRRAVAWRVEDIRDLIARTAQGGAQ